MGFGGLEWRQPAYTVLIRLEYLRVFGQTWYSQREPPFYMLDFCAFRLGLIFIAVNVSYIVHHN